MAGKKKSKKAVHRELVERRFLPGSAQTSVGAFVVGGLGAAALGAGVWGRFFAEPAFEQALYLLVPGAALLAGAVVWGGDQPPVRIGDAGVALDTNAETARVPWCDVERLHVVRGELLVVSRERTIAVPLGAHAKAAACLLAEAQRRIPRVVDVKGSVVDALPKLEEADGEPLVVADLQVAGRRCAQSDQPITFEGDARLCPNCAAVYHRSHVSERCVVCGEKLGARALPVPVPR